MSNSELIEWLKKKAETVTMPGSRKMYQAAVKALEAQKDMVSRKTANVAICNACGKIDCDKMDKCEKLQLPLANCSEFPNNSDTISRQAAIDAINHELRCGAVIDQCGLETAHDLIEELPPTQPEIVRCKDCKYWNSGSCEYPEHAVNCQDYWVGDIETEAEHFCGYAKRREVTA